METADQEKKEEPPKEEEQPKEEPPKDEQPPPKEEEEKPAEEKEILGTDNIHPGEEEDDDYGDMMGPKKQILNIHQIIKKKKLKMSIFQINYHNYMKFWVKMLIKDIIAIF